MRIEDSIEIACTPLDLWPWLVEPERIPLWMEGVVRHTPTSEPPLGAGSTFTTRIHEGGKSVDYEAVITDYLPPEHLGVRMTSPAHPGMAMQIDYRLRPGEPEGTRLEYSAEAELRGLFRLMAPAFATVARVRVQRYFARLRALAEGGAA